jgi:hypothetical protein
VVVNKKNRFAGGFNLYKYLKKETGLVFFSPVNHLFNLYFLKYANLICYPVRIIHTLYRRDGV